LVEDHKDELLAKQEMRKLINEQQLALLRILFDYAQIAIKSIIAVNGFGATAILAFMGNALRGGDTRSPTLVFNARLLALAAGVFAIGVTSGVLATTFAYFSQYEVYLGFENLKLRHELPSAPSPNRWRRRAGIICVFVGIAAFLVGVVMAILAYTSFGLAV
jgi:hypothetical protein